VKDQGNCGSCWAFSATGTAEGFNFLKNGSLESFSEQQLVDCDTSWSPFYPDKGCGGGDMAKALDYIRDKGVMSEKAYPYTGLDGGCKYDTMAPGLYRGIQGHHGVPVDDQDQLVAAIEKMPVSVGIAADEIRLYTGGVFNNWNCGTMIDHGVLAVGYGKVGTQLFWKVKNSWGEKWGEKGFIRMERHAGYGEGICAITQKANYPY